MKTRFPAFLAAASLLIALPAGAQVINRIVATIDGEPITLFELQTFFEQQGAALAERGAPDPATALEALITERLVAREIADKGIVVRDADIDAYIARIEQTNKLEPGQLEVALGRQGVTIAAYREKVRGEIQKIQLLNREIQGRVSVTPQDVERAYEKNKDAYRLPTVVHLRHIVLRVPAEASDSEVEEARARLLEIRRLIVEEGRAFEAVARAQSEDASAPEGGDLGQVDPKSVLREFQQPITELEVGEVSDPIRTRAGLHLLRIEERLDDRTRPLAEVEAELRDQVYKEALDERYRSWLLEDLRARHFVEVKL